MSYFPNDDRFLFTHDQGGNELHHLFVQTPAGETKDLTPGEKLKAAFEQWTRDGGAFYVTSNERDARFFDVYRYDAKTYARTMIYKDEVGYDFGDISDDGKWLAFEKTNTTADSDIYLWNASSKTMTLISKHAGTATYEPEAFDVDSKWLYYTTNDGSEFMRVRRYELATGKSEDVEKADWDIAWTFFSRNGKYRLSAVNQDGRTVLKVWDGRTGAPVALHGIPAGEVSAVRVSNDETKLAFQLDSDRGPNNLYVYAFGAKAPLRLTDTMSKAIDPADLVEAEVVRFPSFDAMPIPNIFYKPWQATSQAKAPALVWVHGGPGGQTRQQYSPYIQYLVNHGYVVLGINNRGSSGYGKSFYTADDKKHGREPLWDCVAAKAYLQSLPYVDPGRIGIIGGSYGGYMVLSALAFKPEEFAVGVDIFGVSNWLRTLESMPQVVGSAARRALQGSRRSAGGSGLPRGDLAALPRRQDPQAPLRHPGRERPAGDPHRVRRHRGGGQEERRARRVRRLPRRRARLHQEEEPDRGLERDPPVPRRVPEGRHEGEGRGLNENSRRSPAFRFAAGVGIPGAGEALDALAHGTRLEHVGHAEAVSAAAAGRREGAGHDGDAVAQGDLGERAGVPRGSLTQRVSPPAGSIQLHSGRCFESRLVSRSSRSRISRLRMARTRSASASSRTATSWPISEPPRSAMIFNRVMRRRISSEARIQPMRRPPQKSFESEPIVRTGASRSKAAIGAGGRPVNARSASVLSSTIGSRSSRDSFASARRQLSGITAPVGFWNVGIRYTSRGAVRATVSRSRVIHAASPPTGTVTRRAPCPAKMSIEPRYVGSSTTTVSPRSTSSAPARPIACCAPCVTRTWSSVVSSPEATRCFAIACRSAGSPIGR